MDRAIAAVLALSWLTLAPSARADCGNALRPSDRADFVLARVHGRTYATHPSLGFRLTPDLPPASPSVVTSLAPRLGSPLSHRWVWAHGNDVVDVVLTCVDGAESAPALRAFAIAHAGRPPEGSTPIGEHAADGSYEIARRLADGRYDVTRHRTVVADGRTLVWSVTVVRTDVDAARRTIASALPPMPTAGPSRSRDEIRAAIRRSVRDVQVCYARAVARDRTLAGRVVASFVIDAAGDVMRSAISETTLGDASTEDCIELVVREMRFGPHDGGVVGVNYPFVLETH